MSPNINKERLAIGYYIDRYNGKLVTYINYYAYHGYDYKFKKIYLKSFPIFSIVYDLLNSAVKHNSNRIKGFREDSNWIMAEEMCRRYIYDNLLTDSERLIVNMGGEYGED